jgi:hypothetical protein
MTLFSWLFGQKKEAEKTETEALSLGLDPPQQRTSNASNLRTLVAHIRWRDDSFPMEVVGESHYQQALISICGRHTRHGYTGVHSAIIMLEPSNPYDANAVVVKISNQVIGYLPRGQALRVGSQMREEGISTAFVKAKVQGGWRTNQYDEGSYGVRLAIPQLGWIDFGIGSTKPETSKSRAKSNRPEPAQTGPLRGEWVAILGAPSDGELAKELAECGAHVMAGFGKSTSLLVVAEEQPFSWGLVTSSQFVAALKRKSEGGKPIRILSLSEARELMR